MNSKKKFSYPEFLKTFFPNAVELICELCKHEWIDFGEEEYLSCPKCGYVNNVEAQRKWK